jgi:hypothetical protein
LLFGGIALGLCLLAGGPVAVVVSAILLIHAASWRFGGWRRRPSPSTFEIVPRGRRTAFRSVLILTATGFAVGGWRCLLMGSRYGIDFWMTWLGADETFAATRGATGWLSKLESANTLVLPLVLLALVGLVTLIREQLHPDEDFVRRHRGLLIIWLAIAGLLWAWRGANQMEVGSIGEFWRIMFIVPLSIVAAVGLVAIVDREVPFEAVVAIGAATLLDVVASGLFGATSRRLQGLADHGLAGGIIIIAALVVPVAAALLGGLGGSREAWQRRIMTGVVLGIVAVNSVWGGLAVRRASHGDRELEDLRSGLSRLTNVVRWTLVTPAANGTPPVAPPAQLLYTLRRVWPEARMLRVDSWAAVATQINGGRTANAAGSHLVVIFSPKGQARPPVPAGLLRAAAPPFIYRDHEIAAYFPGEPPS